MRTPIADFTLDELRAFLEQEQDQGPAGYRTTWEYAEQWGVKLERVRELFRQAKRRGWLLVDHRAQETIDGRRMMVPVYSFEIPEEEQDSVAS